MVFDKVLLFDFEDSFTFNLFHLIDSVIAKDFSLSKKVQLYHWREFPKIIEAELQQQKASDHSLPVLVVFGPGPGHPAEYESLNSVLSIFLKSCTVGRNTFFGVCLGHQILWSCLGHQVKRLAHPVHGHAHRLFLPEWNILSLDSPIEVQKYNSLGVEILDKNLLSPTTYQYQNKIVQLWFDQTGLQGSFHSEGWLSYQFHPESIGTSCPEALIGAILNLRYNIEHGASNRRSLRP